MVRRALPALLAAVLSTIVVHAPAGASPLPVVLDVRAAAGSLPAGFLGLSVEASSMGSTAFDPAVSNLAAQMLALGPGVLTFAGSSVDGTVVWQRHPTDPIPAWATATVTPLKLRTLAALAAATGWKIDLGVNLYHANPARAADEVAAAATILGSSLRNVHLGNEPELYTYTYPIPLTFAQYVQRWSSYRTAILSRVPNARFTGPDTYLPFWYPSLLSTHRVSRSLAELGDHFYPFSDCAGAGVTADQLLSDKPLTRETMAIAKDGALAGPLGIPISLDEFNSISCGSTAPVQWQGASALWVVRALLTAASSGVALVGIQTNLQRCRTYSPLCPVDQAIPTQQSPTPLMSGLRLVAGLEGGTFLRLRTTTGVLPPGISAWALSLPSGGTRIVIANTTATPLADLSITHGPTTFTSVTTMSVPDVTSTALPVVETTVPADASVADRVVPAHTVEILDG